MCMIAGIVNIQNEDEQSSELIEQVTKVMLAAMANGNPHGCGLLLSYQDHEGFFQLKSGNKGEAVAQVLTLDKSKPFKHVLLHARFATQGKVNENNAHPHMGPTGAIVHNGWCPELYGSIEHGWHHNIKELKEKLSQINENGQFQSECDTEALALIFDQDPNEFAKNLVGDEIFAIAHMNNSGEQVTLFTQYNTVHMMYSHAIGAVIFATRGEVLEEVQAFLGESWPITEVPSDCVYYFDGINMTGGRFDFTEAAMENMEKHYSSYYETKKASKSGSSAVTCTTYDCDGEVIERDDLDTYYRSKVALDSDNDWKKTTLDDGSIVWEHHSGEVIHCNAETVQELEQVIQRTQDTPNETLEQMYANMPEESDYESASAADENRGEFLDKDFKEVQETLRQQILEELRSGKNDD